MKERLYFEVDSLPVKKQLAEALKNELKFSRKLVIVNEYNETITTSTKYEVYSNYIDFYLDEVIPDWKTKEPGKIQLIDIYSEKGLKKDKVVEYERVSKIMA